MSILWMLDFVLLIPFLKMIIAFWMKGVNLVPQDPVPSRQGPGRPSSSARAVFSYLRSLFFFSDILYFDFFHCIYYTGKYCLSKYCLLFRK